MTESILDSIKKLLGIASDYNHFDADIIMHINSVFDILWQLGVGPYAGFSISDASTTWEEYTTNEETFNSVKSYIFLKVKMMFDPPSNASLFNVISEQIKEFEWRLMIMADPKE